jgi:DNA repair photolyase
MFVRWSNLTVDEERRHRLPGYAEEAVVRHFDAPEALDTRFYEVHARSILNRVPERSRMPFRWTINPYRGCSHACVYCLGGESGILMADGKTKRLADIRIGDLVYGTVREGAYRRFIATPVLDKWSSIKPAYKVTLEDGTELVASEDHRFLTSRGWKHVIGTEQGRFRRPHLTPASRMLGTGGCVAAPNLDDSYRLGYLCGLTRGDGHVGSYSYPRRGRAHSKVHRFRLALTDHEALSRADNYLADLGVATTSFRFAAGGANRRPISAIRTQPKAGVEEIRSLIAWPTRPDRSWMTGFLAGIFDAEGSCSDHAIRIANTNSKILSWTARCLRALRFDYVLEPTRGENGLTCVRIRGGLSERMRFFLGTDPAVTRKRTIDGDAVKTGGLGVRSISYLGIVMRMYDITTGTGDFIANGVVSHNCFARPTHRYLDFDAGRDFEREIVVKVNAPELLRTELSKRSWKHEHVAMGTNTDPYQWVEGRYRLMSGIWEALRDAENPCSVLTKSPLLLRDLGLMREIAARTSISACLSIPTLDGKAWRATEPHTPNPRARLEAVAELNRAGIPTGVLVAPLMPGINDAPDQLEPLLTGAAEAGATSINGIALHLRGEVREIFMGWLREQRPELVDRYEELYRRGAYAAPSERERLSALVRRPGNHRGIARERGAGGPAGGRFASAREVGMQRETPEPDEPAGQREATPTPSQPSLF